MNYCFVSIGFLRGGVISKFTSKCSSELQMAPALLFRGIKQSRLLLSARGSWVI